MAERETIDSNSDKEPVDEQGGEQQGVTNRPVVEELREQAELPPRGQAKEPDAHA